MMNSLHYPRKGFTFGRKMFISYVRTFWLCLFINLEKMKMKMSETSSVVTKKYKNDKNNGHLEDFNIFMEEARDL